jgi:sugar phosphate isomerase/epimerase
MMSFVVLLGFSTLACPEWEPREIIRRAAGMGADVIEWRGGDEGHVNPATLRSARVVLRDQMADHGVAALAVTAYSDLVAADAAKRDEGVDHLCAHAELAADLGAGFVRAFLGRRPSDSTDGEIRSRAVDALGRVAERIRGWGVAIAVEPHDELVRSALPAAILRDLHDPDVGAVWDPANAFSAGEHPGEGLRELGSWIRYVQLKDGVGRGPAWRLTPVGAGDVPLREVLAGLLARGPLPPLSVEWERAWHPELEAAEVALPAAFATIRGLLAESAPP